MKTNRFKLLVCPESEKHFQEKENPERSEEVTHLETEKCRRFFGVEPAKIVVISVQVQENWSILQ